MKIPKELEFLFKEKNARLWLNRDRTQRPNALYPTTMKSMKEVRRGTEDFVYAMDPGALRLKEELGDKMSNLFKVDVLPNGFGGATAVGATFHGLRNVSGVGMNPLPIPISNNATLIRVNNMAEDIRPEDIPFLVETVKQFFGHVSPADLYIRKEGSTSFAYFTTEVKYKKLATLKALRQIDDFLDKAVGGESALTALANDYGAMFLYAIHERQQPNAITFNIDSGKFESKPRTAPTEEEARTGSYAGKTYADMSVRDKHGNTIEGHFAMRRRDVFGGNGVLNYALTGIIGCFRIVYLNRFAFTYKHRDRHDKARKSAGYKFVVGSDVKTMDKMCPKWFADRVFDLLTNYLDDRVVEVMRRFFAAPYVCPSPWGPDTPEDYNPCFGGSPFKPESFKQNVGLPSGVAFNPDWGKLWMTFVYVIFYRDCGAIVSPAEIEPLLRGLNKQHALLDMSDDAVFLTNSEVVARRFNNPSSPYAILEVERPVIFLGDVFCEVNGQREVYPNPVTYLVNMLCREDSVDRKDPQVWATAYLARRQVYSPTPIFRDMNAIFEELARKHLGFNPYLLARDLAKTEKFDDIEAMVRADPRVLYYKVDPATVHPDVLDDIVSKLHASDFFDQIKHLFKVKTVPYEELA